MPAPANYANNPGMSRMWKVYLHREGDCQKCDGVDTIVQAHDEKEAGERALALDRFKGCVVSSVRRF